MPDQKNEQKNTGIGEGINGEISSSQRAVNKNLSAMGYKNAAETIEQKEAPVQRRTSTVRTYRDFAVKALKDQPTSLAKMIIKEKKKEEINYKYSPKNKKNIFMIFLSVCWCCWEFQQLRVF